MNGDSKIIPTRSLQNNLNSICLSILARSISIICIVSKIQAIKNSVAILLPRNKIIIAEVCNKINTLKRQNDYAMLTKQLIEKVSRF